MGIASSRRRERGYDEGLTKNIAITAQTTSTRTAYCGRCKRITGQTEERMTFADGSTERAVTCAICRTTVEREETAAT